MCRWGDFRRTTGSAGHRHGGQAQEPQYESDQQADAPARREQPDVNMALPSLRLLSRGAREYMPATEGLPSGCFWLLSGTDCFDICLPLRSGVGQPIPSGPSAIPRKPLPWPTSSRPSRSRGMPDVQASQDQRNIPIDKVGVKNIRYPITLHCPATGGVMHTVASVNMYVGLPHYKKGTHLSRFLEVLNKHHDSIRATEVMQICRDMKDRLEAEEAHLELRFPYFINKKAPVSGAPGMLDIEVTFECTSNAESDFIMGIKVPATSLCPCSKEISDYGAHNQRCEMEVRVRFGRACTCGSRTSSPSSGSAPSTGCTRC